MRTSCGLTQGARALERDRRGVDWLKSRVMATEVRAHITGTVWKILVKPGDAVAADQQVAILESMKMEMPLEAPEAGRVASIATSEGASVDEGDLILTLEVE